MTLELDTPLKNAIMRFADLLHRHGEAIGAPAIVLPTAAFFPDPIEQTPESVMRLIGHMRSFAPIHDSIPFAVRFVETEGGASAGGSCSSGACSTQPGSDPSVMRVREHADGYQIDIDVTDVPNPVRLTTAIARALGSVILFEADEIDTADAPAVDAEVAAQLAGFGALTLAGSHIYKKSCGGVSVHQGTALRPSDHAVLLALATRLYDATPRSIRRVLDPTQDELFTASLDFVDCHAELLNGLRTAPASIAAGFFSLEARRGLFARIFGREKTDVPQKASAPPKRPRDPEKERRRREAQALVDAALSEPQSR